MTGVDGFPLTRRRWQVGIMLRTALLAWLVTIGTLLTFAIAMVPAQKRTFLDYLLSKANGVAVSLRDVAAGAAVSQDYGSVVDHCSEMLKGDSAIDYIVLTRNDGFSLIQDRKGWRSGTLGPEWHPDRRVAHGEIRYVPLFDRRVYAFSRPFEYSGIDWGWIHVGLSLDAYDRNVAMVYRRTGVLALGCMLLGFAATMFYASRLVRPILALQTVVRRVAGGNLSVRAATDRDDELGQLAASVNDMTEALLNRDRTLKEANETLERRVRERTRQLEEQMQGSDRARRALAEAQQHLMELSREAGRAEVATGVLHTVGNVLNSVNVSTTLLQDQLGRSQLHGLVRAVELMRAHQPDLGSYVMEDTQGRHLPEFLIEVSTALAAEHAARATELDALAKNVGHIKEIVAMQQSYARVAGVSERLSPRELVQDSVRIKQAAFNNAGVLLVTEFRPAPDVCVDKHKVLQILVNLLTNARWAVGQLPRGQARIRIEVRPGAGRVQFSVEDNGVGIAPEHLPQIFRHGFTTRPDGHGFGLHLSALTAKELGGILAVRSDGPGLGATFTLELPAAPPLSPP